MRLIDPSVEIMQCDYKDFDDVTRMIEKAGRICYKSEHKITTNSHIDFVYMLVNRQHYSPLEHGTIYLKIELPWSAKDALNDSEYKNKYKIKSFYETNEYSRIVRKVDCADTLPYTSTYYITTNYRVLQENDRMDDLKYLSIPEDDHIKRYTFKIVCDRGVGNEIVRHRKLSFCQESTRYVSSCEKKSIKEFNCDCKEDIISAYIQGFSMREIAQYSSLSEWDIRNILISNGVQLRGLHSTGKRDESYFSNIDTPEKAYLLGLIQADGSVKVTKRNAALSITQHKDYSWYIENMLHIFSDKVTKTNDKNCHQLIIGSKSIVSDLMSIGIIPNKTYNQTDIDIDKLWNSVPEEYKGDFIRGLIDGDGWVSYFTQKKGINENCNIGLCSSNKHLIDIIINFIGNNFDYYPKSRYSGGVYKFSITDKNKSVEIGKYLYKNFQYPFGHPKKTSAWIKRLEIKYPVANYKDPKFGIVKPYWLDKCTPEALFIFLYSITCSEDTYVNLRLAGCSPQQARQVLPLGLKTELVVTGFSDDWEHFLSLRTASNAHPDMQIIANAIKDYLYEMAEENQKE